MIPAPEQMKLKFTPTAWAKLLFLRDVGDTEVGGFGICPSSTDNPILVEDIELVEQQCTWATVSFDDNSVADLFDDQVSQRIEAGPVCESLDSYSPWQ